MDVLDNGEECTDDDIATAPDYADDDGEDVYGEDVYGEDGDGDDDDYIL